MRGRTWAWGLFVLFWIGSVAIPAAASQQDSNVPAGPKKEAWQWTLEERLAARFDPEAMAAREAATEMIDGSKAPELFLPGELFDYLLSHVSASDKESAELQGARSGFEPWGAALGLGHDLWSRLEEAAAPYLKLLRNEDQQGRAAMANAAEKDERDLRICQARVQALEAAKAELGEEAFLRLLYGAVAPGVQQASLFSSGYQRQAEKLRFQEEGCR